MIHSRSPPSSVFNSKLNQKKAKPLSSFLSKTRTPLRDLHANVGEPNRKPNDGKAKLKGTDSLKKPLQVLDNIQPKKVVPRKESNQQLKRAQNVTSGVAVGQRTDQQRTAARTKASDHRHFKIYDDANEEQVASMRSSKAAARDEAIGKVRRALPNQEHAAANGQPDTVLGRSNLEATRPMKELVSPINASPLATRNSNAKVYEKTPNGTHSVEKEPISPVSFRVPTNSPVTPIPSITSTPVAAVKVTPVATHIPPHGPSSSQTDCTSTLVEGAGTEVRWSVTPKTYVPPVTQFVRPFSGDSQRSIAESTKAYDDLAPALATCSIAPKPAEMRPILGRKIVGRGDGSPPMTNRTGPMRTLYPTRNTITKLPEFHHLTEYFPDRADEIQHYYRQKELRRRRAIESMMIQNTRQTHQDGSSNAVTLAALYREPNNPGNGFGEQPVDKYGNPNNKYGVIGQTKNGYASGVCARQLDPKQAAKQTISYETEELLRMNFLVCRNLCHSKTQARNKKCVRSNAAHGTAIGTRR